MTAQFKILFALSVTHGYYGGACQDIDYLIPPGTQLMLRNGRILSKQVDGKLYLIYETKDANVPLVPLFEQTIRIGLKLTNPHFSNFTNLPADLSSSLLLYRNSATPDALDDFILTAPAGQVFSHQLGYNGRPVTVELRDRFGFLLQENVIADNRSTISYGPEPVVSGQYRIRETFHQNSQDFAYYCDSYLNQASVFAVVEIGIDTAFYSTPAEFEVAFAAREEILKYYVVAKNYSASDFNQFAVTDTGFAKDARPRIDFTKVSAGNFAATDIPASLLAGDANRVVMFESEAPVARGQKSRQNIQLTKGNQVLIENLPQPGEINSSSSLIIAVSKP